MNTIMAFVDSWNMFWYQVDLFFQGIGLAIGVGLILVYGLLHLNYIFKRRRRK